MFLKGRGVQFPLQALPLLQKVLCHSSSQSPGATVFVSFEAAKPPPWVALKTVPRR